MRIVMDGAGDLPAELIAKHHICVVPINVAFGTEEFMTGVDIDHEHFYRKVETVGPGKFPKTSQPTPFQFSEIYKSILAEGEDEILSIVVSNKLSGTYASAMAAGRQLADQGVFHLFDSESGSAAQGYMALEAARLAESGASIARITAHLEQMRENQVVVLLIDSLEYALKGGRVSSLASTVSSLLNIKPVMVVADGLIVQAGKVRTHRRAIDFIVNYVKQQVGDRPVKVAYVHARAKDHAIELQRKVRLKLKISEEIMTDLAVSVAVNLGPGTVGLVAIPAT